MINISRKNLLVVGLLIGISALAISIIFSRNLQGKEVTNISNPRIDHPASNTQSVYQDDQDAYQHSVKNLHEGWKEIRVGNGYFLKGDFTAAAARYKSAYDTDPGNRMMSGGKLIETYERLGRFDEAISIVDDILNSQQLVEGGIKRYTNIKSRLVAAKNASRK